MLRLGFLIVFCVIIFLFAYLFNSNEPKPEEFFDFIPEIDGTKTASGKIGGRPFRVKTGAAYRYIENHNGVEYFKVVLFGVEVKSPCKLVDFNISYGQQATFMAASKVGVLTFEDILVKKPDGSSLYLEGAVLWGYVGFRAGKHGLGGGGGTNRWVVRTERIETETLSGSVKAVFSEGYPEYKIEGSFRVKICKKRELLALSLDEIPFITKNLRKSLSDLGDTKYLYDQVLEIIDVHKLGRGCSDKNKDDLPFSCALSPN